MSKKIVLIDMDNTIADFGSGIRYCEEHNIPLSDKVDETSGLFSHLEPVPGAIAACEILFEKFDAYICTTVPWKNETAANDKFRWVDKYLPMFKKRVIMTHKKNLVRGDLLIDDRTSNGAGEFPGELIRFGSDRFPDWNSVLEYLGAKD